MKFAYEIYDFLKIIAPLMLAESYDNPGLLVGSGQQQVNKALVALDITSDVCLEAVQKDAQLVISHHPVIFKPVRAVLREGETAPLWQLVNNSLTAICMHTNLDSAAGGVNDALAEALGFKKPSVLLVRGVKNYKKVAVYVPRAYAQAVRQSIAQAGAGSLGAYDSCSFETEGIGYFRPLEGAKPFIGQVGSVEQVSEVKLEAICAPSITNNVVEAIKRVHPYEQPAIEIFDDESNSEAYGIGRLALLSHTQELEAFVRFVTKSLLSGGARFASAGRKVSSVAICSGAWDAELTVEAVLKGADTILTGEIKHSDILAALDCGLNVIAAGHFATENVICPVLASKLSTEFPDVRFEVAQSGKDAMFYIKND